MGFEKNDLWLEGGGYGHFKSIEFLQENENISGYWGQKMPAPEKLLGFCLLEVITSITTVSTKLLCIFIHGSNNLHWLS